VKGGGLVFGAFAGAMVFLTLTGAGFLIAYLAGL